MKDLNYEEDSIFYKFRVLFLILSIGINALPFVNLTSSFDISLVDRGTVVSGNALCLIVGIVFYGIFLFMNHNSNIWIVAPKLSYAYLLLVTIEMFFSLMFIGVKTDNTPLFVLIACIVLIVFGLIYPTHKFSNPNRKS